jgi:hypothetical protein
MSERASHCPTCGSAVTVVMADEGTSYYKPLSTEWVDKELRDQLQESREALRRIERGLTTGGHPLPRAAMRLIAREALGGQP